MDLIERLINKDYLTERERKEWLGTIKERLEVLEKENKELKDQHEKDFEIISKQAYLLNNQHIDKPIIELYKQENKKLKKAVTMLYLVAKLYDMEVYNNLDEKDKNLLEEVLSNDIDKR